MSYKVKLIRTKSGQLRPVLLSRDGISPIPSANLWCQELLRNGDCFNTAKSYLFDLKLLYEWADSNGISLYERFSSLSGLKLTEMRNLSQRLHEAVRTPTKVNLRTHNRRIRSIKSYCLFELDRYLDRVRLEDSRYNKGARVRDRTNRYFERLTTPDTFDSKSTEPLEIKHIELIESIAHPNSPHNPFRNRLHRIRNYCLLHLSIEAWLRRSELVLLEIDDIDLGYESTLMVKHPTLNAKNKRKDGAALKTRGKIVPITPNMSALLKNYLDEIRPQFVQSKTPSKSLFLSERDGARLSTHSMYRITQAISTAIKATHNTEITLHPHMLRSTGATNFRRAAANQLLPNSELINRGDLSEMMNYMGGWSNTSEMPRRYAKKAIIEQIRGVRNDSHKS